MFMYYRTGNNMNQNKKYDQGKNSESLEQDVIVDETLGLHLAHTVFSGWKKHHT